MAAGLEQSVLTYGEPSPMSRKASFVGNREERAWYKPQHPKKQPWRTSTSRPDQDFTCCILLLRSSLPMNCASD